MKRCLRVFDISSRKSNRKDTIREIYSRSIPPSMVPPSMVPPSMESLTYGFINSNPFAVKRYIGGTIV